MKKKLKNSEGVRPQESPDSAEVFLFFKNYIIRTGSEPHWGLIRSWFLN